MRLPWRPKTVDNAWIRDMQQVCLCRCRQHGIPLQSVFNLDAGSESEQTVLANASVEVPPLKFTWQITLQQAANRTPQLAACDTNGAHLRCTLTKGAYDRGGPGVVYRTYWSFKVLSMSTVWVSLLLPTCRRMYPGRYATPHVQI